MFKRLFLDHPHSLGESYFEHQKQALAFGISMLLAGCACVVHALVPALFVRTGSETVTRLHTSMSRRATLAAGRRPGDVEAHRGTERTKVPQPHSA